MSNTAKLTALELIKLSKQIRRFNDEDLIKPATFEDVEKAIERELEIIKLQGDPKPPA